MGKNVKIMIRPYILIKIYKTMKLSPSKVWVISDFTGGNKENYSYYRRHLNTLIALGLVREVEAMWTCGKGYTRRSTQGYKLIIIKESSQ